MWSINLTLIFTLFMLLAEWRAVYPFEDGTVLPAGVRRVMLSTFHAKIGKESDQFGHPSPMSNRLARDISFEEFIKVRKGIERTQIESFLQANDIPQDQVVGRLTADLKGNLDVFAPSLSWGVTERLSVGVALPIYRAVTDVSLGFMPNQNAENFVALLADPENGQTHKSHEAVDALNGVTDTLNQKLEDNGYQRLGRWEATGLGDILVKGKYQAASNAVFRSAVNFGVALPTGRKDDPDILTDVAFGDGGWDIAVGPTLDEMLFGPFFLNQYALYTLQLPDERTVRMKTADEPIAVEKKKVRYDLGDKIDAGTSLQWDTIAGFTGGLGYNFQHKFKDKYHAGASSSEYEKNTTQTAHLLETSIGYSSLNGFRAKRIGVPFAASAGYLKQLQTRNTPLCDRLQFEAKVFF